MSNSPAQDTRRASRRAARAPSTLRVDGVGPIDVMVHDISETGIRFATPTRLQVGDEVSIGLAGFGSTRARVAWARDDTFGCTFAAPIDAEAAAGAFTAGTVVRLGRSEAPPVGGARPVSIAAQVDALYARHRRWAFPRDVRVIGAAAVLAAAALLWPLI